jgi:hypothetical protein
MAKSWVQVGVHSDFFEWLKARAENRGKSKAAELNEIRQLVQRVEGQQANGEPTPAAVRND